MTEYKYLNLILFINCLIILNSIFFPWILVEKGFQIDDNCTIYPYDNFGLYFDSLCGVDITVYEPNFAVVRWLCAFSTIPTLLTFVIFNWHIKTFSVENVEKLILIFLSFVEIVLISIILYFWHTLELSFLPRDSVTFFGFGYISFLLHLCIWITLITWCSVSYFIFNEG